MTLNSLAVIWYQNSSVYRPVRGVGERQIDVMLSPLSVHTKHTLVSHLLGRCYCWDWTIIHCIIIFWDTGCAQYGPALGRVGLMLKLMLVPRIQCYYPLVFYVVFYLFWPKQISSDFPPPATSSSFIRGNTEVFPSQLRDVIWQPEEEDANVSLAASCSFMDSLFRLWNAIHSSPFDYILFEQVSDVLSRPALQFVLQVLQTALCNPAQDYFGLAAAAIAVCLFVSTLQEWRH